MDGHESYTVSVLAETSKGGNVAGDGPAGELLSVDCSTQHCAIVVYKPIPSIATAGAMMVGCMPSYLEPSTHLVFCHMSCSVNEEKWHRVNPTGM